MPGCTSGRAEAGAGRGGGPHYSLFLTPQEKQYAHWMAGCRLASKGRTMADSSYPSEVQAILAFLSLQRTGGGGSGGHPQGPDAAAEGLNPYGLVAPRFQRKFKAKQVGASQRKWVVGVTTPEPPQSLSFERPVLAHSFPYPCP